MERITVNWVIATDTGKVRNKNEDAISVLSLSNLVNMEEISITIFAISDGIGGKKRGEVASKIAVKTVISHLYKTLIKKNFSNIPEVIDYSEDTISNKSLSILIKESIEEADYKIKNIKKMNEEEIEIGATITCGILVNEVLTLGYVGDTRCYLFYEEKLKQLTRDHTVASDVKFNSPLKNDKKYSLVLTRSLGNKNTAEPEIKVSVLDRGCKLLFCTDGLYKEIGDEKILEILKKEENIEKASQSLINEALKMGGSDNISLILVNI